MINPSHGCRTSDAELVRPVVGDCPEHHADVPLIRQLSTAGHAPLRSAIVLQRPHGVILPDYRMRNSHAAVDRKSYGNVLRMSGVNDSGR